MLLTHNILTNKKKIKNDMLGKIGLHSLQKKKTKTKMNK